MKVGDWVFFKTRNWPKDVQHTRIDPATGESKDIAGQGFYDGRGKIIGIAGSNITVREEKSNRRSGEECRRTTAPWTNFTTLSKFAWDGKTSTCTPS